MSIPLQNEIHYPESDGRPMDSEIHGKVLGDLRFALVRRYDAVPDVYAWGNMFLYYREGDITARVTPDVFLVKGVGKKKENCRRTYKLWEEGDRVPSLVIEITSEGTRDEDQEKQRLYERLGVEELFLFDPYGDYLQPRLQGYRLQGGQYQPLLPRADGALESCTTGLLLKPEGYRLRLQEKDTGEVLPLLWAEDENKARMAAEARVRQEAEARKAAEERLRLLEEELNRLRQRTE